MIRHEIVAVDDDLPAVKLLREANAYVLMFSAQDPRALEDVERRYRQVRQVSTRLRLRPRSLPAVVLTALTDGKQRLVSTDQCRAWADRLRCAYAEVPNASATDGGVGQQVLSVLNLVRRRAADQSINDRIRTAPGGSAKITDIPTMPKELDLSAPAVIQGYVAAAARADASLPTGGAIALSSGPISRVVRIAVVGPSCVGKTRLVTSLLSDNGQHSPSGSPGRYIPTKVETYTTSIKLDGEICPIEVVDTGGNDHIRRQVAEMLWEVDVCIAVYDPRWDRSGENLVRMLEDLAMSGGMSPYGAHLMPPVVVVAFDGRPVAPSSQRSASGRTAPKLPSEWSWIRVETLATQPASIADAFCTAVRQAVRQAKPSRYDDFRLL